MKDFLRVNWDLSAHHLRSISGKNIPADNSDPYKTALKVLSDLDYAVCIQIQVRIQR